VTGELVVLGKYKERQFMTNSQHIQPHPLLQYLQYELAIRTNIGKQLYGIPVE